MIGKTQLKNHTLSKERGIEKWFCPSCEKIVEGYPAISRREHQAEICSDCGTKEALTDFALRGN